MDASMTLIYCVSFFSVVIALAFAVYLHLWVKRQPVENRTIREVSALIKAGANTFMRKEYRILAIFAGVAAVLLFIFLPNPIWSQEFEAVKNLQMVIAYIAGTVLSAIAGKMGIIVATSSNGRSAEAAQKGIEPAFLIGFRGGAVMGLAVVGISLFGVAGVLMLFGDTTISLGFSFGASSLALFAKAGGGIFTKTADVSADLTGKVELGIPEDDPRNPAVIADNVGDNVGDVAGMGADLFDSNVAAMTSALVLATSLQAAGSQFADVAMVFMYAALGLISSIIGIATARIGKGGTPTKALNLLDLRHLRRVRRADRAGHADLPGILLAHLGRVHGRPRGRRHHRPDDGLLHRRQQADRQEGRACVALRLGVHRAVRRLLWLHLGASGHDRHRRLRAGRV